MAELDSSLWTDEKPHSRERGNCRFVLFLTAICLFAVAFSLADSADSPPKKKRKHWLQTLGHTLGTISGEAQKPTAVAGVRGLEESPGTTDTQARDYAAMDKLDKISVSETELRQFKKEGGLP